MKDVKREIVLKIKGNNYTVKFPTVGQLRTIESLKQELTAGQYGAMAQSNLKRQWDAIESVDVEAFFSVLIPTLTRDLKVPISKIDAIDFKEIVNIYRTQFVPWYEDWYELFSATDEK